MIPWLDTLSLGSEQLLEKRASVTRCQAGGRPARSLAQCVYEWEYLFITSGRGRVLVFRHAHNHGHAHYDNGGIDLQNYALVIPRDENIPFTVKSANFVSWSSRLIISLQNQIIATDILETRNCRERRGKNNNHARAA